MAKRALLIGVSQYEAGLPPLAAAPKDVAAMERILQSPELGAFDEVKLLIDRDLEAMQTAIDLLFQSCQKGDLGLLYFSGHGITDDNDRLYLATRGTSKDTFRSTAVSARFIQDIMRDRSYQRQHVLILDCCYSGAFAEGWLAKSVDINLKPQLEVEGSVVLTSSTSTQKSYEDKEGELSLYTNYIVQGIESGAAESDGDGMISADELHEYAKRHVQSAKPAMKPDIFSQKQGIKILLAKARVDTKLEYRRLVERYAENGEISSVGQDILEFKRESWNISDELAIKIENEVLEPDRKRLKNLDRYEKSLEKTCKKQFPLTKKVMEELKELQELLGLRDEDIHPIEQRVMALYVPNPFRLSQSNFIALILLVTTGLVGGGYWFVSQTENLITILPTVSPTTITASNNFNVDTSLPNPSVLTMDGSTSMVVIIKELRAAYRQSHPTLPTTYGFPDGKPNGSSPGLQNLINGNVWIAATSRKLTPEEEKSLQSFPIAKDAIGLAVGIDNPFKGNLTKDQVRDIYQGKITNWLEVGGTNLPIKVINRPTTSGTRKSFQDMVLPPDGQSFAPDSANFRTWENDETTPILRELKDSGISYATFTQLKDPLVRIIAINGVSPTDETLKSGKYPLIRDLFLAVKKTTSPAAKEFIEFALSPQGQEIVKNIGFLPINSIK